MHRAVSLMQPNGRARGAEVYAGRKCGRQQGCVVGVPGAGTRRAAPYQLHTGLLLRRRRGADRATEICDRSAQRVVVVEKGAEMGVVVGVCVLGAPASPDSHVWRVELEAVVGAVRGDLAAPLFQLGGRQAEQPGRLLRGPDHIPHR